MGAAKGAVEIEDRRGNAGHLRLSWHPEKRTVNVSQWRGGVCVSTTPVAMSDVPAIVNLLVGALEEAARMPAPPEESSEKGSGPGTGVGPTGRRFPGRGLLRRTRRRIRPPHLAQVIHFPRGPQRPVR